MARTLKTVSLLAAIWLALYGAGRYAAKSISPDFTRTDEVKGYVVDHVYQGFRAGTTDPLTQRGPLDRTVAFRCGDEVYGWVPRTRTAFAPDAAPPAWLTGKYERVRLGAPDVTVLAGMLGLPSIKTIPETLEAFSHFSKSSKGMATVVVVGMITGGVLGFWLNWKPDPDCASESVQSVLRDPTFWSQLHEGMTRQNLLSQR